MEAVECLVIGAGVVGLAVAGAGAGCPRGRRRRPASSRSRPHAGAQGRRGGAWAMIALATPVVSGRAHGDGATIETGGAEPMWFTATLVVNAAGLDAQAVARVIDGLPPDKIPPPFLAMGNYFSLTVRSPFSRLVYPMPAPGGLGASVGRPQPPAMTSPATTVAACFFRSRARKSSRFPMSGPRAY